MDEHARTRFAYDVAFQLQRRMRRLAWWRAVMVRYPGGVVPTCTAREILGVSRARISAMIRDGVLPGIGPMPGGNPQQRFVPIDALLGAPTRLEAGRPLVRDAGNPLGKRFGPLPNPWMEADTDHNPL